MLQKSGSVMEVLQLGGGTFWWSIARTSQPFVTRPRCSKNSSERPQKDGNGGSRDWDKAWSSFRKKGKKTPFSQFKADKYVTWNPRRSEYPLSEEVDPIKRTERSNLMLWTSPQFTLVGAIVVVSVLLIYTILVPLK